MLTKLDLHSAYNLLRLCEGGDWMMTLVTPTGYYEYLVMPYGLVSTPSIFQDCMHEVLQEFLHWFVLIYIDDILVYSWSMAKHCQHVEEVLKSLREFHPFLKTRKCSFHQSSGQFLDYHISKYSTQMDNGKVEAIKNWPIPTTIKELQCFLVFANFY